MDDNITILETQYYIKRFISSGITKLIVPNCPYCHKKHIHERPLDLGTRLKVAHCSLSGYPKYYKLTTKLSKVRGIVD
jgi:hypothetical protein